MKDDEGPLEAINPKKFYTTDEIAERARVLPRTVCGWCQLGMFPNARRIRKRWLIPGYDYQKLLDSGPPSDGM